MSRKIFGIAVALAVAGCGGRQPIDFKFGVPTKEQVDVAVPTSAGSGLQEEMTAGEAMSLMGGVGETADLFELTKGATYLVNGATAWVIGGLAAVTAHRPTSVEGETAVYGPHTPFLSRVTWRLSVTRTEYNIFTYILEAKEKTAPETAFAIVMSGSHTVAVNSRGVPTPLYGNGTFLIEWDKASELSGGARNEGSVEFRYGHLAPAADATVEVSFNNIATGEGGTQTFNSEYRFKLEPGQAGEFEFALDINMQPFTPSMGALERWSVKSRWDKEGAGRSDVRATGGDLTAPQTVNECWDAVFLSTFYAQSDGQAAQYGNEATHCVYTSASYSAL